jgi:putative ATP-grasp target RiPP
VTVQTHKPWGLSRMAPYPESGSLPYARVELDPQTQTGVWLDEAGLPVPVAERHKKTTTATETLTQTSHHDGTPDSSDSDSDQASSDSD